MTCEPAECGTLPSTARQTPTAACSTALMATTSQNRTTMLLTAEMSLIIGQNLQSGFMGHTMSCIVCKMALQNRMLMSTTNLVHDWGMTVQPLYNVQGVTTDLCKDWKE